MFVVRLSVPAFHMSIAAGTKEPRCLLLLQPPPPRWCDRLTLLLLGLLLDTCCHRYPFPTTVPSETAKSPSNSFRRVRHPSEKIINHNETNNKKRDSGQDVEQQPEPLQQSTTTTTTATMIVKYYSDCFVAATSVEKFGAHDGLCGHLLLPNGILVACPHIVHSV